AIKGNILQDATRLWCHKLMLLVSGRLLELHCPLLNTEWELVLQERSLEAEGSTSCSPLTDPRNHENHNPSQRSGPARERRFSTFTQLTYSCFFPEELKLPSTGVLKERSSPLSSRHPSAAGLTIREGNNYFPATLLGATSEADSCLGRNITLKAVLLLAELGTRQISVQPGSTFHMKLCESVKPSFQPSEQDVASRDAAALRVGRASTGSRGVEASGASGAD
ncbi:unnamed protein product, partial [Pleuronectes platessa]